MRGERAERRSGFGGLLFYLFGWRFGGNLLSTSGTTERAFFCVVFIYLIVYK